MIHTIIHINYYMKGSVFFMSNWRYCPSSLSDFEGNEKIKETLLGVLGSDKRPQVILIQGDSGSGKTALARLIAKLYRCKNSKYGCEGCSSCKVMDTYIKTGDTSQLTGVVEIPMSTQSGVDCDLLFSDMKAPNFCDSWKIFIIDECHTETFILQYRLLRVIEEPQDRVLFILCTTNPDDLLNELRHRCEVILSVESLDEGSTVKLLSKVCKERGWNIPIYTLQIIAQSSTNTRDALAKLSDYCKE